MIMRLTYIFFVLSLIVLCRADHETIQEATIQDLETLVAQQRNVVVVFYASWCHYCRLFYGTLKVFDSLINPYLEQYNLSILRVNIEDYDKDELKSYQITGYPTILLYTPEKRYKLTESYSTANFLSFMSSRLHIAAYTLNSIDLFQEIHSTSIITSVLMIDTQDHTTESIYNISPRYRYPVYFTTSNRTVIEYLQNTTSPSLPALYTYKNVDEGLSIYNGDFSATSVAHYLKDQSTPVLYLSSNSLLRPYIYNETLESLVFYFPSSSTTYSLLINNIHISPSLATFIQACKSLHSLCAYIPATETTTRTFYIPNTEDQDHIIFVRKIRGYKRKYSYSHYYSNVSFGSLMEMEHNIDSHMILPELKSQSSLEHVQGFLQPLSGELFHSLYKSASINPFVVYFYSPYCDHCTASRGNMKKLARLFRIKNIPIPFYDLDTTTNDIDVEEIYARNYHGLFVFSDHVYEYPNGDKGIDERKAKQFIMNIWNQKKQQENDEL
ncbi:hypothetical protein WA158_005252 [Blastocystis sp. Blastoise]